MSHLPIGHKIRVVFISVLVVLIAILTLWRGPFPSFVNGVIAGALISIAAIKMDRGFAWGKKFEGLLTGEKGN